jgi:hypothetical protein
MIRGTGKESLVQVEAFVLQLRYSMTKLEHAVGEEAGESRLMLK